MTGRPLLDQGTGEGGGVICSEGTRQASGFGGGTTHQVRTSCTTEGRVVKFLVWLILLVLCWPLALLALVAYPFVWLLLLPFRLLGIVVDGVFEFLRAILMLPARVLGGRR
jgi:hypothetical protein